MRTRLFGLGMSALLVMSGAVHAGTEWNAQDYDLYSGDFNGDGKADILYIAKDPSMPSGIALTDSSGAPNTNWQSWPSNYLGIQWSGNTYNVIVADFNGDGKADILLQSVLPGNSFLILTSPKGYVVSIAQTIAENAMGVDWSADQHHIVAGDFNGDHKADLFLQATTSEGTNAVVLADNNGTFSGTSPSQTWTDGYLGFKWSTQSANVFAGDFNGDGLADLLIQAKPLFITINYDVPFPVPTYPPNMNGVVLAQAATPMFAAAGMQAWSRMSSGVDWSPLTNTVIVGTDGANQSVVVLQARNTGAISYELIGNATGAIFPSTATALTSNVSLSSSSYQLVAGNFGGGAGSSIGLYYQALTPGGTNYITDSVGSTITASIENPATVTGTVEPTSAGRTAGQFSITPTGGATYNIPIWTSPGARNIEPHLALHYRSGGPDGVMGAGWSVAGISAIVRCGKTWASNGSPLGVSLSTSDDLCLDGNRLRLISGVQGMGGSLYMTELADFSLITANGSAGSPLTSFTIQGKDGRNYEYGNTTDSAIKASGSSVPYAWAIDKVSDRQLNNMVYSYVAGSTTIAIAAIQYTQTPGSGAGYGYKVSFGYGVRVGGTALSKYVAGGAVTQASQLTSINVASAGTTVRQYNLAYGVSPTTNRPLLSSVQECGGGAATDCLRPTTFDYQSGAAGWSGSGIATGLTGQYGFVSIDLNGDGFPDALYAKLSGNGLHWYARIATSGNGYGAEIDTGATTGSGQSIIQGSFTGAGRQQFLAPVGTTWYVYSYNGSGFSSSSTGVTLGTTQTTGIEQQAVDWDGDGLPDLLATNYNGSTTTIYVRRNITTPGGPVTFAATATNVASLPFLGSFALGTAQFVDVNGDGRVDLFSTHPRCTIKGGCNGNIINMIISNGFTAPAFVTQDYVTAGTAVPNGTPGDWNGDGCTDLIGADAIYISDCTGNFIALPNSALPANAGLSLAVDYDGDGLTDRVYVDSTTNTWYVQKSTGNGISAPIPTGVPAPSSSISSAFASDRNSDGQPDLFLVDSTNSYGVSVYLHNGVNTPPDLLTTVTDGFGITFNPTYVPISQSSIYAKGVNASYPDRDFTGAMYVVNQYVASDGTGNTYPTNFTYSGARVNLQGRGFEGFSATTAIDGRNNLVHSTAYSQVFPTIGAVLEDDVYQQGGVIPINRTSTTYAINQLNTGSPLSGYTVAGGGCSWSCFAYSSATNTFRYEVGGVKSGQLISTAATSYTYDAFGSATLTNSSVTDQDTGSPFYAQSWTTQLANSIANYPSTWCLGRPSISTTTSTAPGQASLTRTVNHSIDSNNCRATSEIVEPASPLMVTTTFGYDSCGNTNSVAVAGVDENGVAMPPRVTTTTYDTQCQFPEYVTNPLNQTSSATYRYDLGLKASITDANGLATTWTYDDFGRKTRETHPDATSVTWNYSDCVSTNCWGTGDLRFQTTETLFDSAGNTVRVHEMLADGFDRNRYDEGNRVLGVWSTAITHYDSLGRRTEVDLPSSGSGNGYHLYAYDVTNRVVSDALYTASGSQYRKISMGYAGQTTTVTDPKGNVITKVTDVTGKLRQMLDPAEGVHGAAAGVTNYVYDSLGNLIKIVDAIGATSSYTYNVRGFKTGAVDADTGAWTYQSDSLNELKVQTDANGAVTKYTYDALGRMITRLEPEFSAPTSWTYGNSASAHNIGQLASVSKPDGYAESYAYDNWERLQTKIYTEEGVNYQFDYGYNPRGTIDTLTYPVSTSGYRFSLKYMYDASGYLNATQDANSGTSFWTLTGADDSNAPTMEVLGNGVSVATGYTPWTNEMVTRTEGAAGSTNNLQNLNYTWDLNGNLIQRVDTRQGLTEILNVDALNRLSAVSLNGVQTLTVTYDQAGDITYKSDVGNYNYPAPTAARPHAVTSAGSWAINYDANGNMISRDGGAISAYSYNLPNQINFNGSSSQFSYDSNHQRWKQVANYAGTIETTHYIGGLFQVVTRGSSPTEYRHQIPAGSSLASYTRRSDGTTNSYYATSDHLGSADLVLDGAANVLVRESFSAFGSRRGSNWQGLPTTADYSAIQSSTRRGYTGQEMLDAVSLIHLNGRVYDPTIGRFLSADSVITNLAASQSVNPYSYAWNNPLKYVDPSGHGFLDSLFSIVAVVFAFAIAVETYGLLGPGFASALISGFVGGFLGAWITTNSLSASLTAGLIGAITAGAFFGAGDFTEWMSNVAPEWEQATGFLSHAAIGCLRSAASGGNCGRGALAAAVAQQAAPVEQSVAVWGGPEAGVAAAGIVGGVTSLVKGGQFESGFSVGAAGYLYNDYSHTMAQSQASGGSTTFVDPNDATAGIIATGSRSSGGPLLAQVIDPVPVLGIDEYLESPAMQALRQGRLPTPAERAASQPNYGTQTGTPPQEPATNPSMTPPMPQGVPQGGFWLQFWYVVSKWFNNFSGAAPAAPPICTAPTCQA